MDFHRYPISQSLIRKFLYKGNEIEGCPKKIYHTEIFRDFPTELEGPRLDGMYFESGVIGTSASGLNVIDLPRKKLTKLQIAQNEKAIREGKKPPNIPIKKIGQIRLDHQMKIFEQLAFKYQLSIFPKTNTQVHIMKLWESDNRIMLSMTLDIFPTYVLGFKDGEDKIYWSIVDLKVTGNIHNTFGPYCYGDAEHLDKIQGRMYHYGVRDIDYKLNPELVNLLQPGCVRAIEENRIRFLMWVFDYKKEELENKFVEVKWGHSEKAELFESIRKTVSIIEDHEMQGWPTKPEYSFCNKCPLVHCPDKTVVEVI